MERRLRKSLVKIETVEPAAITPVYFDSALIAKFYLNEPGREAVRAVAKRGGLDKSVFLRALDGMHLVTAKAEGFQRIYSNDRHLLSASASVGLEGVNPISEYRPDISSELPSQIRKKTPRTKTPP